MNEREAARKLLTVLQEIEAAGHAVCAGEDMLFVGKKYQLDAPNWRADDSVWELSGE